MSTTVKTATQELKMLDEINCKKPKVLDQKNSALNWRKWKIQRDWERTSTKKKDGHIVYKGRITGAYSIYLTGKCQFTKLVVEDAHLITRHGLVRPEIIKSFFLSEWWKEILTQNPEFFSPFFHVVALFVPYFTLWFCILHLKCFIHIETSFCYILNVCKISKMPSKVFVIVTFYIFWSLNQGGRTIVWTKHLVSTFCISFF